MSFASPLRKYGDCMHLLNLKEGILRLYRGFEISFATIFTYRGTYFGLFYSLKPVVLTDHLTDNFAAKCALALASTISANLAYNPVNRILGHMVATPSGGFLPSMFQLVATNGVLYLFSGPILLRSLSGALLLAGFDTLQSIFLRRAQARALRDETLKLI